MTNEKKTILAKLYRFGYALVGTTCDFRRDTDTTDRWTAWGHIPQPGCIKRKARFARCEIDALRKLVGAVREANPQPPIPRRHD